MTDSPLYTPEECEGWTYWLAIAIPAAAALSIIAVLLVQP